MSSPDHVGRIWVLMNGRRPMDAAARFRACDGKRTLRGLVNGPFSRLCWETYPGQPRGLRKS
jgi:hypothetical protein